MIQELRWNPFLEEWVMVSSIREERPWRSGGCPFCEGAPEMGRGWRVRIVENKYPMLSPRAPEPERHWFYRRGRARGKCLVLVETPIHNIEDISDLSTNNIVEVIESVIGVMEDSMREGYRYVFWFRNKGEEIGVSQPHPHSQIYVMDFTPSLVRKEIESSRRYMNEASKCLGCEVLSAEKRDGYRIVYENESWTAFLPFYARWPFEVHIYPKRHVDLLTRLTRREVEGLATALKNVLCGLQRVLGRPMPYMLALHQAPLSGEPSYHLHLEIYGVYRRNGRLKYAAGMEMAGGNFTYDSSPESNASLLRDSVLRCLLGR
ncbi:MAG: galactose-1-phosphate uridylyltransferase [Desulfurococcales archaeon]|nr:galactose-1-phosphate uridylyltransferase [Desulfurococcales archaeon]